MSEILLHTKLLVPRQRPGLVERPRLVEKVNHRSSAKLLLVSAPAGYGKTTFVVHWLNRLATTDSRWSDSTVGWVSLDETDNDPAAFMAYLVAAIGQAVGDETWGEGVNLLMQANDTPTRAAVSQLLNGINMLEKPHILVLDDYHLIHHDAVHQIVTTMLDHQPTNLMLVLITRVEPPLPLARLRLRGELCEIEVADLRFSQVETAEYFRRTTEISLTAEQLTALNAQTEGWAAGLQAAALSLQRHQDVDRFLATFKGRQRFVLDYLVDEVYQQQSLAIQTFLRQTAVCDRICAPLCEALLTAEQWALDPGDLPYRQRHEPLSAQSVLEYLDAANLFVVPLDEDRRWYRYHHLFREFLQTRLAQVEPEQLPAIHRRAAAWFAENGFVEQAIGHRLSAGDTQEAATMIAAHARQKITRGEGVTLQRWLDALPEDLVRSNPHLCLAQATLLTFVRDIQRTEEYLKAAETAVARSPQMPPAEADQILGGVAVYRAMVALWQGRPELTSRLCREALRQLRAHDSYLTGLASLLLGMTAEPSSLQQAQSAFADALAVGRATGDIMLVNSATGNLAAVYARQGRLHRAVECYHEALDLAADKQGQPFPVAAGAYVGLAQILREWNELTRADDYLSRATTLAERANLPAVLLEASVASAVLHWARQDWGQALAALDAGEALAHDQQRPDYARRLAAVRARIALAQGHLDEALQWAEGCGLAIGDVPEEQDVSRYLILVRIIIGLARAESAPETLAPVLQQLSQMEDTARARGQIDSQIFLLILQVLAHDVREASDSALAALERATALAEPGGYVRVFADDGRFLTRYLRLLTPKAVGATVAYIGTLLAASEPLTGANDLLVEPLTSREMEVLKLLVAGLSNREIADTLVIAEGTAKRHVSNIYGKLGVGSRAQAIARAYELNLLTT